MIDNYRITLSYDNRKKFTGNPGYNIYACLMELLPDKLCEYMHENAKTPISQNIEYNNSIGKAVWNINSFDEILTSAIEEVLENNNEFLIEKDNISLKKVNIEKAHIHGFNDIRKYTKSISEGHCTTLQFRTTTALKNKNEFLLFPDLNLILDNLWKQWNAVFPNHAFEDDDVLRLLKHESSIYSYNLSSSFFKMKGHHIRGFYGKITVNNRLSPPLREILLALFAFAEFNGIGVKNALGMGKTQIVRDIQMFDA